MKSKISLMLVLLFLLACHTGSELPIISQPQRVASFDEYGWIDFVAYGNRLIIKAGDRPIIVDFGQSVIDTQDYRNGDKRKQVYYLLCQMEIPAGESHMVYAVCGGNGGNLPKGSIVLPGPRVDSHSACEIAAMVELIKQNYRQASEMQNEAQMMLVKSICSYMRAVVIENMNRQLKQCFALL